MAEGEGVLEEVAITQRRPANAAWHHTTFDAFGVPAYRLLWLNSAFMLLAVNLAFTLQNVVTFDITGRNSAVGLVAFAQGIAMLASTPPAGVVADAMSKRLLLAVAEGALGLMALGISVLILAGIISLAWMVGAGV